MPYQVSYKKQLALGIMLFLVLIGVIEGLSRGYEFFNPRCSFIDDPKDALSNIDYFLLRAICNDTVQVLHIQSTILLIAPDQHFATININSQGFRGPEISLEKPPNTYRIFVMGGSTTYGVGATSDETTIPGFLAQKFNTIDSDIAIEIINAGVGGAESTAEVYRIKNILWDFEPDLFIIFDGVNDAQNDPYELDLNKAENDQKEEIQFFKFANFPYYRTPFVIYDVLFRDNVDIMFKEIDDSLIPNRIYHWKNNWIETCTLNKEKGIKTLLVVQPMLGSGNKPLSPDESKIVPHSELQLRAIDGFAESLPELDEYCDKTADLRNLFYNVPEPLYFDLFHTTDFGNEIVAQKLFELSYPMVKEDLELGVG